jgi:hypothetical protein
MTQEQRTRLYCAFKACAYCKAQRGEFCHGKHGPLTHGYHWVRGPWAHDRIPPGKAGQALRERYNKLRTQILNEGEIPGHE